jgi:hypothetical protein
MAFKPVDLTVSQLLEDLSNGLTWLKAEDQGFGSIEEKYNAKEFQIKVIMKHPKLVGKEPEGVIFRIIDDTKDKDNANNTESAANKPAAGTGATPSVDAAKDSQQPTVSTGNVPAAAKEAGQTNQSSGSGADLPAQANKSNGVVLPLGASKPGVGSTQAGSAGISDNSLVASESQQDSDVEAGQSFLNL